MYMFLSHVSIIPTLLNFPGLWLRQSFLLMLPCIFSSSHSVGSLSRSYLDMLILRKIALHWYHFHSTFPISYVQSSFLAVLNLCSVSYVLLNPPQLIFCPHLFMKLLTKVTNGLYIAISEDFCDAFTWYLGTIITSYCSSLEQFSCGFWRQSACDFLSYFPAFLSQHLF